MLSAVSYHERGSGDSPSIGTLDMQNALQKNKRASGRISPKIQNALKNKSECFGTIEINFSFYDVLGNFCLRALSCCFIEKRT